MFSRRILWCRSERHEDEEATVPPGGAHADGVLVACFAATQEAASGLYRLATRPTLPCFHSLQQKAKSSKNCPNTLLSKKVHRSQSSLSD